MIPALIVPVLRTDLVRRMLATVDEPVGITVIIDNGGRLGAVDGAHVVTLPTNLGVAASWNLGIKVTARAPWWAIVNDDVAFAQGQLATLAATVSQPGPRIAAFGGFHAFGINREALRRVGYFDENYHPAYVEDVDMEYRARLAEVPIVNLGPIEHQGSATINEPEYRRQNARTYPANVEYHRRKWGGGVRSGDRFATPFDAGGPIGCWTLDPDRLAEQGWETTMRMPDGEEVR
jgi:hypothetical protein